MKKQCKSCGKKLPLTHFSRHPHMADGRKNDCKDCTRRVYVRDLERAVMDERRKLIECFDNSRWPGAADFIHTLAPFKYKFVNRRKMG